MIKIDYSDVKKFKDEYLKIPAFAARKKLFEKFYNNPTTSFNKIFSGKNDFEKLLSSSFTELTILKSTIEANIRKYKIEINNIHELWKVFEYDGDMQQKYISKFFEEHIQLSTCFYCNIDFINIFSSKYLDSVDFVNNASEEELRTIDGIGPAIAKQIALQNNITDLKNLTISRGGDKIIKNLQKADLEKIAIKNCFTLDHFYEKSKYPYFALSLFNFVPSCYTCNSKLKGVKEIGGISPSDPDFDFHKQVKFKVFIDANYGDPIIKSNNDLLTIDKNKINLRLIDKKNDFKNYIEVFRLNARYNYHKGQVVEMINKRQKYPDSMIEELANRTKQTKEQVKKDLFGNINEKDLSKRPLSKLMRDIADELGL